MLGGSGNSSFFPAEYPATNRSSQLRARGNLSYLQFVDLVKLLWERGHKDIPIVPQAGQHQFDSQKAYIVYSELHRRAHTNEPKPVHREEIFDSETQQSIIVTAQRFHCLVAFSAVHVDPRVAEELIEAFDDFFLDITPVLKQLGTSDLLFSRRDADMNDSRDNKDVSRRTSVYQITIEKLRATPIGRLEEMEIYGRVFLNTYESVKTTVDNSDKVAIFLQDQNATPNL